MIQIKKIILYLCMVTLLVSNISISAFASDLNDGVNDGFDRYMGGTNIQGFNSWDITDKKSLFATNIVSFFSSIGMYFRNGSGGNLMDIFTTHLIESDRIENADNLDEYIASHLTANTDETELYMSSDLTNALHETAVQYIEEETPWENMYTTSVIEFYNLFKTKQAYDKFCEVAKSLKSNEIILLERAFDSVWHADEAYYEYFYHYRVVNFDGLVKYRKLDTKLSSVIPYYQWKYSYNLSDVMSIDDNGNIDTYLNSKGSAYNNDSSYYSIKNYNFVQTFSGSSNTSYWLVENISHCHRVYDSVETYKQYSLGQRPYYVTDAFSNYDSTVDNSTTITQTEIDNSVTYGDVYNYITNNYDNPDGLSEDELRAILAEYLSQINNNNSGGGSGGSDNGSGSGGGLGGFLDGLGSVGNAILSILGKLMEILGSAIELVTGAITDLITIIPNSIGELLGALFPVFPEEWIKAITLSLVLGVVVGIVRMFK